MVSKPKVPAFARKKALKPADPDQNVMVSPVWTCCLTAIESGVADLTDPIQQMMVDYLESRSRIKEIQAAKFTCLDVGRSTSNLDRIVLSIVDSDFYSKLEKEQRAIEKREREIIKHFGRVAHLIQSAAEDTSCKSLTFYGLVEYRTELTNLISTMNARLKQRLITRMERPRETLESAQNNLKYIEMKKEIDERISQTEAIIKKLDAHL